MARLCFLVSHLPPVMSCDFDFNERSSGAASFCALHTAPWGEPAASDSTPVPELTRSRPLLCPLRNRNRTTPWAVSYTFHCTDIERPYNDWKLEGCCLRFYFLQLREFLCHSFYLLCHLWQTMLLFCYFKTRVYHCGQTQNDGSIPSYMCDSRLLAIFKYCGFR